MNNAHEEAERILNLVKQLKEGSADEKLQAQIIESALVRERNSVVEQACDALEELQTYQMQENGQWDDDQTPTPVIVLSEAQQAVRDRLKP